MDVSEGGVLECWIYVGMSETIQVDTSRGDFTSRKKFLAQLPLDLAPLNLEMAAVTNFF